jgi:hypothetical protein
MKTKMPGALFCFAAILTSVLTAQTARTILGTVTEFKANSFEMGVKSDAGETMFLPFGTDTEVMQIPPGDRVMVSFVAGTPETRRIVLISSREISKRNDAEKLDWQKRGISGVAASRKGNEITVEIRTPQGAALPWSPSRKRPGFAATPPIR